MFGILTFHCAELFGALAFYKNQGELVVGV